MLKKQIRVDGVYRMKVSNKVVDVRIDSVATTGGWWGTNLNTGRKVRIKSAGKLRMEVTEHKAAKDQYRP